MIKVYHWEPRPCVECAGSGEVAPHDHPNDPHADWVECEKCSGTGRAYGTCGDCGSDEFLAERHDLCRRCDRAQWEETRAEMSA